MSVPKARKERWEWLPTDLGTALPELVGRYSGRLSGLFVESLDGVCDPGHVRKVLLSLAVPLLEHPLPVLSAAVLEIDFKDDRFFPGYDAVWLIEDVAGLRSAPPFMTYPAAEGIDRLPTLVGTAVPLDSARPVFEWMRRNSVVAGMASGYGVRVAELDSGRP